MENREIIYKCNFLNCIDDKQSDGKCFQDSDKQKILNHIFINHSSEAIFNMKCFVPNCKRYFKNFIALKKHINSHKHSEISHENIKCNFKDCSNKFNNLKGLYKCYFSHIRELKNSNSAQSLNCFYENCNYENLNIDETTARAFSSHLSKYHKNEEEKKASFLKESCRIDNAEIENQNEYNLNDNDNDNYNDNDDVYEEGWGRDSFALKYQKKMIAFENFYHRLYIKLKDRYLIAKYKCDELFSDIDDIIETNNLGLLDYIDNCKTLYKPEKTLELVEYYIKTNQSLYSKVHKYSKFDSAKDSFLKKTGYFVKPQEIRLNTPEIEKYKELNPKYGKIKKNQYKTYQVTSLMGTIQALFKNKEFQNEYFKPRLPNPEKKIRSFRDGEIFKNNELFQKEPDALQIVLYNDGFDSHNPIGDKRQELKTNATYFKIGNLDISYQSVDHFTQSLILCDNALFEFYKFHKIFAPSLEELKILENEGVMVNYKDVFINLKGTISFVAADNLAAHKIGGFVESFNEKTSK